MSIAPRQLVKTYSPTASTNASDADSDAETMSNAESSESGYSIEIGGTTEETQRLREESARLRETFGKKSTSSAVAVAVAKQRREDPLDGAKAYCSMCSINSSEYLCVHCGRLAFCTKCCLNLHDNKYLSAHKFQILDSIPEGEECLLDDIKKKKLLKEDEEAASRRAMQSSTLGRTNENVRFLDSSVRGSKAANVSQSTAHAAPKIDMASLTADKSVINVRIRELQTCLDGAQQLHKELAQERNTAKETTATAIEAVKRRFDVLRGLIKAKEDQFVAVVEQAGKERFDLATTATCSMNIAAAELDGFISHMNLQMDRFEDNREQFNAQRQGMLGTTEVKLSSVDGWMHDHQTRLEDIRNMSLGVHVPIDEAADAIQAIQPPKYLTHKGAEELRKGMLSIQEAASVPAGEILSPGRHRQGQPVTASKFVDAPGVKVIVQSQAVHRAPSTLHRTIPTTGGLNNSRASSPFQQEGRKLHTIEQQELRSTPMRDVVRPQWKEEAKVRQATSPLAGRQSAALSHKNDASISSTLNASSIHGGVRPTTPTRRVFGRNDSQASQTSSTGGGVGRPTVARPTVPTSTSRYGDPYAQRVVADVVKAYVSRATHPIGTSQRFTTSPVRSTASPVRTPTSPSRPAATSSFALPTANAVRRGGSPVRQPASIMYKGSSDNPGPGAYNIPTGTFGRKSPVRR